MTLLFFAKAREIIGRSQQPIRLPTVISAETLKEKLIILYPGLEQLGKTFILAHNEDYIETGDITLRTGDELAVIPPISGG